MDQTHSQKPIAVTMGEPAGIGAEIVAKTWRARGDLDLPAFFVIDDPKRFENHLPVREIKGPGAAAAIFDDALPVLPLRLAAPVCMGRPEPQNAPMVMESIDRAIDFCAGGQAAAMVTSPIQKGTLRLAGFNHPGHTEYIAGRLNGASGSADQPVMMLIAKDLRVVPLTIHMPLAQVSGSINQDMICKQALITAKALRQDFGIARPRLAVAGLNPHAGEHGQFGREEIDIIAPAIQALRNQGLQVDGPFPADTLFHEDARRTYDAALCMYHDQALIPLKTLDFYGGVNITLGLSIVRTSPDHGTALNIAGQGQARPDSLIAAIRQARQIANARAAQAHDLAA